MTFLTDSDFPPLTNDLILRAARGEPTERAPVWIMRQAGRYLPEYREVASRHPFFEICRTPELATKVTLQPIERFPGLLDASIIFSDILVIPQALGMEVQMLPEKGPHFPSPLKDPGDLKKLEKVVDVHKSLGYVFDAITRTRMALNGRVPLFGFSGAPWTLMAYMVEGGGSKSFLTAKKWFYQYSEATHELLQRLTDVIVDYLVAQVGAGAQMLQIFDSWAGELTPDDFKAFSLPYLTQIASRVKETLGRIGATVVPMFVFAKGVHFALDELSRCGYDVISLDWTIDPLAAKARTQGRVTLQGNLDPCMLFAPEEAIREVTRTMLEKFGTHQRYIANLGHGMLPTHTPEGLRAYLQAVKDISTEMNQHA
ncbi:uroporphyrinogen decarboxylase [Basidiobolus meristosporus CBS 931.73]|uniref:Uroporphyrinogen decarboxylase n=1 Tax=Basidiobolus meristosporus CBS 931.73 TaxID=1314790 RepID=A0A1Y1X9H8_9FUNG|nr:uroporphyrinogen decarboxylase [Basidiobolus meristosporus CBS 931.73]|eukprot:ORX82403.1 uroporphyrinogen decarboxylase [Basidiobolus meristosporus CBS 931.73]